MDSTLYLTYLLLCWISALFAIYMVVPFVDAVAKSDGEEK
jgi:hypothetical protein